MTELVLEAQEIFSSTSAFPSPTRDPSSSLMEGTFDTKFPSGAKETDNLLMDLMSSFG